MKAIKRITIILIIICLLLVGVGYFYHYQKSLLPYSIKTVINKDNKLELTFKLSPYKINKDIYCLLSYDSKKLPKNWIKAKNNKCVFDVENKEYYIFLKTHEGKIISSDENIGVIKNFKFAKENVYLAVGGSEKLEYKYDAYGNTTSLKLKYEISDENVLEIKDDIVYGKNAGNAVVKGYFNGKIYDEINVTVTTLIIPKPATFDFWKSYVSCNMFSEADAKLLDTMLFDRVDTAGRGTRAGVLAAVRFLMLEWPYRINYFSENGRMLNFAGANIDGEGRYYHLGLYVSPDKYNLINKENIMHGPASWGCPMYSFPAEGVRRNGLDCSGFISWVLYNGGFDVKDVGAGPHPTLSLISYGELYDLNYDIFNNHTIRAGDLLHQGYNGDTHIALIAGIKDGKYYVAESLWGNPWVGPVIVEYTKDSLIRAFDRIIFMDSYYKEDGKYTEMWY